MRRIARSLAAFRRRVRLVVFAVLNGLRLMAQGWPQGFAVATLRRLRLDLGKEHARILKQNPDELFDKQEIWKNAQPGDIAVDNTDPVFLTIASKRF